MKEATYHALKMAQEYHERKYDNSKDSTYPSMAEILATAKEIYDFIIALDPDADESFEEFPLEITEQL
jgi:phosphomannomutase